MFAVLLFSGAPFLFENLTCGHDEFMHAHYKNLPVFKNLGKINHRAQTLASESPHPRKPIRIKFNFDLIEKGIDRHVCGPVTSGRVVTSDLSFCTKSRRVTRDRLLRLKMICERVEDILTRLIKVTPVTSFDVDGIDDPEITVPLVGKTVTNIDLLMFVTARPDSKNAAWSAPLQLLNDGRPVTGILNVNPKILDSSVNDRQAWGQLLHEMFHVLGISDALYHYWINPRTGYAYGKQQFPLYKESSLYMGKQFLVAHTRHSHRVAVERYGAKEFFPGKPSGVVLEEKEQGNQLLGTFSHLKGSVYYNELMVSEPILPMVMSNVSLAMLMDTGWYDVNASLAEPLPFGDGEALGVAKSANFAVSSPQKAFPSDYFLPGRIPRENCSFDYMGVVRSVLSIKPKCNKKKNRNSDVCQAKDYYIPMISRISSNVFWDYQLFGKPTGTFCSEQQVPNEIGARGGPDSICVMTSFGHATLYERPNCLPTYCLANGSLEIIVNGHSVICDRQGETKKVRRVIGHLTCPNPKRVCQMKKYMTRHSPNIGLFGPLNPLGVTGRVSVSASRAAAFVACALIVLGASRLVMKRVRKSMDENAFALGKEPKSHKLLA